MTLIGESYQSKQRGKIRETKFVDLNKLTIISILHIFGFGEIGKVETSIPSNSCVFDEINAYHDYKVQEIVNSFKELQDVPEVD